MARLDEILGDTLERRKKAGRLRQLTVRSPEKIDFSSNDYLSLAADTELQRKILARLEERICATERGEVARGILGSGGSRLLDGNSEFAEQLEEKIAGFHGAPAALLFNSAYDANVGLLQCVPQPGDVILYDEAIHASSHEGMRLSRASAKIPFAHDSMTTADSDSPNTGSHEGLEQVLQNLTKGHQGRAVREGSRNVFICVEGIYSMDGSVAHLARVVDLVEKWLPRQNGYIIVDEAHSVGVLGPQGRGLVSALGLETKIWAIVQGFGKALGSAGGVVLCSHTTRAYLVNYARTLIYTTSPAYSSLVSLDTIYDYLLAGNGDCRHDQLQQLIAHTWHLLQAMCSRLAAAAASTTDAALVRVDRLQAKSPIIPIYTSSPRSLAAWCQQRGFMVRPIVAPTVPAGTERVRICLHAMNSIGQVDALITTIEHWAREQKCLSTAQHMTSPGTVTGHSVLLKSNL
ncbi:hypothetical protein PFICI_05462 [Pestalotiopsis fici W106-1]|uniref:Aminotransferase class I/classII large domain-containing protein n=1 Tax=Pestalotiopsis fici (strain W106-1 / CGMCC3.15140) TaxID=1229662 RepID=W3XEG3_PESFW|nr:uncharacterized protein PFICI_05462 [Pestalotiopsis fici W106-1]ETS83586.1 hypothetical protein PFICI_05462 [Pestalotiopsis fici W106-1]